MQHCFFVRFQLDFPSNPKYEASKRAATDRWRRLIEVRIILKFARTDVGSQNLLCYKILLVYKPCV